MLTSRGCQGFTRRDILHLGAVGLSSLTLPNLLRAEQAKTGSGPAPKAKNVIFIWQQGGPPHQDMWDMKPGIPTKSAVSSSRSRPTCPATRFAS